MAISKEKKKNLNNLLADLRKNVKADVNFANDVMDKLEIKYIETPSVELNMSLGGGLAVGKILELYGQESSGKTSLAIETIAKNMKENPEFVAGWFETEGSISKDQLEDFGVDTDRLVYWDQCDVGAEKGFEILRGLVASGEFDIICINSVAGLNPKVELESDLEKSNVALTARLMSKLFRVVTSVADSSKTTLLFVNQLRMKVGVMFGNPETTTGGRALSYYASQRVNMRRVALDKADPVTKEEGLKIICNITKNRYAKKDPFKTSSYFAKYGIGIQTLYEYPLILLREGILVKSGSWIYYKESNSDKNKIIAGVECKWRSFKALVKELEGNKPLLNEFKRLIKELINEGSGIALADNDIKAIEKEEAELDELFEKLK